MTVEERLAAIEAQLASLQEMVDYLHGEPDWYEIGQAAELLGVKPATVRGWCRCGRIHAERDEQIASANRRWRISKKEVARYRREGLLPANKSLNRTNLGLPGETRLAGCDDTAAASPLSCAPRNRQSFAGPHHHSPG